MLISSPLKNPLCIALDVDSKEQALRLTEELADLAGGFKLGPRLINRYGSELVERIAKKAPVFVDCKFFDIPSTMLAAVQAAFDSGASLVTVHALSGAEALTCLAELEQNLSKQRPFRILAVTILTSWNEQSFPANFRQQSVPNHVLQLAELTKSSGLSSVVCSPEEIGLLKSLGMYLLTPGIRFSDEASNDDQKRVLGPKEALALGSSALVVGRPIIQAKKPREAAEKFIAAIR